MLEINFTPFPILETKRLLLRRIDEKDLHDLFQLRSLKEVMRYIDRPLAISITDAEILLEKMNQGLENNEGIAWAITIKDNPQLIGTISYHRIEKENYRAEIGYMLHPDFWKKGIASEAIKQVLDFGFNTMNLHSIEANINPENKASSGVLRKFNFIKEAHYKENYFYDGKFLDTEIYSLLCPQ